VIWDCSALLEREKNNGESFSTLSSEGYTTPSKLGLSDYAKSGSPIVSMQDESGFSAGISWKAKMISSAQEGV
jgi:hypothetical protein